MGKHKTERGLDAGHAEGGKLELAVLLVGRVRRVVSDDGVDRAVGEATAKRGDVGLRAKRRVHLVVRIVILADHRVVEKQMVRRDLAGDGQPLCLGGADELKPPRGRDVLRVEMTARQAAKRDVAHDFELLAFRRPT